MRDYFVPRETLKDLCDLASWWTSARSDLGELLDAAREAERATSLCALRAILCCRDSGHPAQAGVAALERTMSARERGESRAFTKALGAHRRCRPALGPVIRDSLRAASGARM